MSGSRNAMVPFFRKILLSLLIGFNAIINTKAQIISYDRMMHWTPGIQGGIPDIASPVENILDYGADPNGINDSYPAFIKALNNLPGTGGVVLIPSGIYRIDSTIRISKDKVVFRGDTNQIPRLLFYADGNCFEIISLETGSWQKLISYYTKGSDSVCVEEIAGFRDYRFAEIMQENDSAILYTRQEWDQLWSKDCVGQLFEIDSLTNNTIFLKTPVHYDFSPAQNPQIRPIDLIVNVGFENFYIEKKRAAGHTFYFQNTAWCWIKGVESYHTRKSHVIFTTSLGNEVRESYFHHSFDYGGGGSGYGVECNLHTTDVLVENNIFDSLRHAMMVQMGANGNVFAYNYSIHPVQGAGETNLNEGWIPPDISVHGHYPYMNLFEGNCVDEIGIGDYWGPAGPGNTYFRNKVNDEGINYYDHSDHQNVIGNITTKLVYNDSTSRDNIEAGNLINSVLTGKYDAKTGLPNSFYLGKAPSFLNRSQLPVYGPGIPVNNKLPAQIRYEELLSKPK